MDNDLTDSDAEELGGGITLPLGDKRRPHTVNTGTGTEKNERRSKSDQHLDQTNGLGFIALLLAFFINANGKTLEENGAADKLSGALGLDLDAFKQTISNVISGKTVAASAAIAVTESLEPDKINWSALNKIEVPSIIGHNNDTILHPDLVKKMQSNPDIAQRVQWTLEAAAEEGIDGKLLANQFWQESRFNPNALSSAGAKGIAQFMPFHKGKWGLETDQDFEDPKTSIFAGAKFMGHLSDKIGSQHLAMVAYNGGERAIKYAEENMSSSGDITIGKWMEFMEQERQEKGIGARNLWRNQTYEYITKIDPSYMDQKTLASAAQQSEMALAFNNGGTDQRTGPVLTPQFGQGTDEIAATIERDALAAAKSNDPATAPNIIS